MNCRGHSFLYRDYKYLHSVMIMPPFKVSWMFSARHLVKRENLACILRSCKDLISLHNGLKLVSPLILKIKFIALFCIVFDCYIFFSLARSPYLRSKLENSVSLLKSMQFVQLSCLRYAALRSILRSLWVALDIIWFIWESYCRLECSCMWR